MRDATPAPILLSEYTPPQFWVDKVDLHVTLHPTATRVRAKLALRPNANNPGDLVLDGEGLTLNWASIDGAAVTPTLSETNLTIPLEHLPQGPFIWEAETQINPSTNTALEGLYMSNGMYCTQCEAEGFRKITFYPDRPDVMSIFTVTIDGDAPVKLSNGNPTGPGQWHDPWLKPAYLFALVAGDLVSVDDSFVTLSGRQVDLKIWVRPGDEGRCDFAMDALKRSMRWDEQVYGREYDLDLFQIVAVDDFNMGAMENKGLNIFNSKYVLASADTATDADYERIEAIIAHEYFHNWTGNRITCRDWFQLCLKEGLTVFRDQQFSGDMRSEPVRRIEDVLTLRARQFREDAGPLAHPVRPECYVEINNFYTATVYEKGAEVIRMLKLLVGDAGYDAALNLYFQRHDGQACTIEDWIAVFEEATGRDLSQFKRWYSQAGTPRLHVTTQWDNGTYRMTFRQDTPPTPGQPLKEPLVIPVALGLLNRQGQEIVPTNIIALRDPEETIEFRNLDAEPVPSILRGFSAPVILDRDTPVSEKLLLLAHDTDPFNRWEAGRSLARETLAEMVLGQAQPAPDYLDALDRLAGDAALDPAFRALALALPSEDDIAQTLANRGRVPDPSTIHAAREELALAIALRLQATLSAEYDAQRVDGPYTPDAQDAGKRALRGAALRFLSRIEGPDRAAAQFDRADNMTESLAALSALLTIGAGDHALAAFHDRWQADRLVMDKWFALQISHAAPDRAVPLARQLTDHPLFDWKNPNRFRSVIGALTGNAAGFHSPDGAGYAFLADWLIQLDPVNPQTAARMSTAFETWHRYDTDRQGKIRAELDRIRAIPGLSRDTGEMIDRILNG